MNIRAPHLQDVVNPSNASHDQASTDTAHESTQTSVISDTPSIEQECDAMLVRFSSGKRVDAQRHNDPFNENTVIVAFSQVARDGSPDRKQAFSGRAVGKSKADNDIPQILHKNLIFY